MACIHFKFKNSLDYDSVTFDGLHISLGDLKKAIMQRKKLKDTDVDLLIVNAITKKAYQETEEMIPKNTSVIVSRTPLANAVKPSGPKTLNAYPKDEPRSVRSMILCLV